MNGSGGGGALDWPGLGEGISGKSGNCLVSGMHHRRRRGHAEQEGVNSELLSGDAVGKFPRRRVGATRQEDARDVIAQTNSE